MRADEAIQAVTYFIDDAVQFCAGRVRILHGTGHGILKTLIRQQLQANTAVKTLLMKISVSEARALPWLNWNDFFTILFQKCLK